MYKPKCKTFYSIKNKYEYMIVDSSITSFEG